MIRVLSLGAGVQSTTVLLLALEGEIAPFDAAIFADTGWEPRAVYAHLAALEARAHDAGVPLLRVTGGSILAMTPFGTGGALDAPFFLDAPRGLAMARRQCTSKLKVAPVRRAIRTLMRERGARRATLAFGISTDEIQRVRTSPVAYLEHAYPLLDLGWARRDCAAYLERDGIRAPRSACIGCPYHADAEWRRIRDETPDEWAAAVAWEADVQRTAAATGLAAVPYVHRSRVPLADVDLTTAEDHGQLTLADECEGMCGV